MIYGRWRHCLKVEAALPALWERSCNRLIYGRLSYQVRQRCSVDRCAYVVCAKPTGEYKNQITQNKIRKIQLFLRIRPPVEIGSAARASSSLRDLGSSFSSTCPRLSVMRRVDYQYSKNNNDNDNNKVASNGRRISWREWFVRSSTRFCTWSVDCPRRLHKIYRIVKRKKLTRRTASTKRTSVRVCSLPHPITQPQQTDTYERVHARIPEVK